MEKTTMYDLVIVGAGVSGAAQYYAAATYTDIKNVLLVEKESAAGLINSAPTNNSQTLHEGDIETNYNKEKAAAAKHKSGFTRVYLENNKSDQHGDLYLKGPKMVLGVGEKEIRFLEDRFTDITDTFPGLQKLDTEAIAKRDPKIVEGRDPNVPLLALYNEDGLTINYGALAAELVNDGRAAFASTPERNGAVRFNTKVSEITKTNDGWSIRLNGEEVQTKYLSICAGAHSMYFAKQLGLEDVAIRSLLLIAGNFYYTPKYLHTKVYTVQNPKLPFSAVHGDPDILHQHDKTRYGPTTRIVVQLERGRWGTFLEYVSTLAPFFASMAAYVRIMLDREFFFYALRHNVLFLVPGLGNYLFVKEVQKIIPTARYADLKRARGHGGVRPQIVRTSEKNPLNLGEAKLSGERIRINVTPSPGATTCLYNGLSDIRDITTELGYTFLNQQMVADFGSDLNT